MPAKAPRIPNEIWDQHKEAIIAFYLTADNSLERTIDHMDENYGFRPSKNQYTRKLELWGIRKYLPGSIWAGVESTKRKRSQEGKDSDFAFPGRKYTRRKVEKEIARHVPLGSKWSSPEDAVLADYISVSTPPAELTGISRDFLLRNIPWYRYTQEIQTLVLDGLQKSITQSTPGTSLESAVKELAPKSNSYLAELLAISDTTSEIHTYLPPEDLDSISFSTGNLETSEKKSPFSVLKVFLQRFIFLSTNNLLYKWQFNKICHWIVGKCGTDVFVFLYRIKSPSMKVFTRKILFSAVESGNIRFASRIIQCEAQLQDEDPSQSQRWAECLSRAVCLGHEAIVELLCKAGVPPKIENKLSWNAKLESRLPILNTFLVFGANPDSFITEEEPGFPLIDAAHDGNLRAVELLVNAKARIDHYNPLYCGSALQAAASQGHLKIAKYLIQYGADINVPHGPPLENYHLSDMGMDKLIPLQTPVQIAARMNNIALLQFLLERGAFAMACPVSTHPDFEHSRSYEAAYDWIQSKNDTPRYHSMDFIYTPLQYGVINQDLKIVTLLLSNGVAPDFRAAPDVDTPLQMSARLGSLDICRLLLISGADVNAPPASFNGRTALQGAAESGSWEILTTLQRAGAQINAPAGEELGMSSLQAACLKGHSLMAGFLLAHGASLSAAPSSVAGLTPIQAAATHGDIGLVRDLINLGAQPDAPAAEMGTTALVAAVKHKSLPLLKLLVKHGANVNPIGDFQLRSPLMEAACWDWLEGVEFLLEHGANANDTPFGLAASGEHKKYISEILSPLGWALANNAEKMIDSLLQHGADVLATAIWYGNVSQSALVYSLDLESSLLSDHIIDLLLAHVPDLEKYPEWDEILEIFLQRYEGIYIGIRELIIEKISSLSPSLRRKIIQSAWNKLLTPNFFTEEESSLLEVIELFIRLGASLDSCAKDGSTLLQRTACSDYYEACSFLVSHGAAVNTHATRQYGTPLQEALKAGEVGVANLLLDHGADINALPAEDCGVTALQAASIKGMFGMAVRLLVCGADVSAPAAPINGRTTIDGAAEHGRLEMVQLILSTYGEHEDLGPVRSQAAHYAEKEGHYEIAQWLQGDSPV